MSETPRSQLQFMQKIQMVHDNNCLFRAISYGLNGRQGDYSEVKVEINSMVFQNWDYFKEFAIDAKGNLFPSLNAYKTFAMKRNRMGDFADVVAASFAFDCPITVYRGDDVTFVGEGRPGTRICLLFSGSTDGGYYDVLEFKWSDAPRLSSYADAVGARASVVVRSSPTALGAACSVPSGQPKLRPAAPDQPQANSARRQQQSSAGGSSRPAGARLASNVNKPLSVDSNGYLHVSNLAAVLLPAQVPVQTSNRFQIFAEIPEKSETIVLKYQKVKRKQKKQVRIPTVKDIVDRPEIQLAPEVLKFGNKHSHSLALNITSPSVISPVRGDGNDSGSDDNDDTELLAVISTQIGTVKRTSLLDGGATVNCISKTILRKALPDAIIQSTNKMLVAANKNPLKTFGIWVGCLYIGGVKFEAKFYVCDKLSHDIILGNKFLFKFKANICYEKLQARFKSKSQTVTVPFGVFYRPQDDYNKIIDALDISSIDVPCTYTGPTFLRPERKVVIQPGMVKWVKVISFPMNFTEDTTFIGNPHLLRNYGLMVSDFILSPAGNCFIPVTNTSTKVRSVHPNLNLAVDDGQEDVFFDSFQVNSVSEGSPAAPEEPRFNINPNLDPEQHNKGYDLLEEFRDVFVSDVSELRRCKYPPVHVDYDVTKIVRQRNYRMSPDEKEFLEKYIQKLLGADLIEQSMSVYSSPILCVPKAGGGKQNYRLVQDFRKINKILKDVKYPIPNQQELIDSFQGKTWHSVSDNCSGYTQIPLDKSSRDITSFDSPSGTRYRWKAIPQGLSVAPSIYALCMDNLFLRLKKSGKVQNYFDDTHIGTETFDEHLVVLREFFELLREYRIQLNIKKSTFFQRKVIFLGLEIDGTHVRVAPKRIKALRELPEPKDKSQLKSTVGIFGYNRRFISNYSKRALPLISLLKEDAEFVWDDAQKNSFLNLRDELSNPPALRLFNPRWNNRVTTDASRLGLGVSFYQQDPETKRFHPVAFESRKLKPSEAQLPIYYLECAAIVYAFVKFRPYLLNRNVQTEVLTDHHSLQSLLKTPNPEGYIAKHIMYLSQFNFTLKYRPGRQNLDADGLSRAPVGDIPCKSVDDLVNEVFPDRVDISKEMSAAAAVTTRAQLAQQAQAEKEAKLLDEINRNDKKELMSFLLDKSLIIRDLQQSDPELQSIIETLTTGKLASDVGRFNLKNGLLYKEHNSRSLLVVPRSCRKYVLAEFHDNRGHRAPKHLVENIMVHFFWKTLRADAKTYVSTCKYCSVTANNSHNKPALLHPPLPPKRIFSRISCDFVGTLTLTNQKNAHICVIVDYYSKYMWTRAVKKADTETAISCLKSFTLQFGLCDEYTSDSASYFTSFAFQSMLNQWDIFHNAFRRVPHCNGQCERTIQELKKILAQFLLQFGDEWDKYLEMTTFLYNVNYHGAIKCSPFLAVHGYNPVMPGLMQLFPDNNLSLEDKLKQHATLLKDLRLRIKDSQVRTKKYYDKGRKEVSYLIGQMVRVRDESDEIAWPRRRIRWSAPRKIVGRKSKHFYFVLSTVRTKSGRKKTVVKEYHVCNMKPFNKRPIEFRVSPLVSSSVQAVVCKAVQDQELNICSWNVSSLRAVVRKGNWLPFLKLAPDIVCLQETRCGINQIPDEIFSSGYPFVFFSPLVQIRYSGVAVLSKVKPNVVAFGIENKYEDRIVTLTFDRFTLVNVYVPYAGENFKKLERRIQWQNCFQKYIATLQQSETVIVCGDFNVAHNDIDVHRSLRDGDLPGFSKTERDGFGQLLKSGLIDTYRKLHPESKSFSFWQLGGNRRRENVGWRLDYILLPESKTRSLRQAMVHDKVEGSDHCPVSCRLRMKHFHLGDALLSPVQVTMEHCRGDVLQAPANFVIAHCISDNLRLGAGIARTIQERYRVREMIRGLPHHVGCAVPTTSRGRVFYNLITKHHHGDKPQDEDIEKSLFSMRFEMQRRGHWFLAMPEIACGLDGKHLPSIIRTVERVFRNSGIKIVMYHL